VFLSLTEDAPGGTPLGPTAPGLVSRTGPPVPPPGLPAAPPAVSPPAVSPPPTPRYLCRRHPRRRRPGRRVPSRRHDPPHPRRAPPAVRPPAVPPAPGRRLPDLARRARGQRGAVKPQLRRRPGAGRPAGRRLRLTAAAAGEPVRRQGDHDAGAEPGSGPDQGGLEPVHLPGTDGPGLLFRPPLLLRRQRRQPGHHRRGPDRPGRLRGRRRLRRGGVGRRYLPTAAHLGASAAPGAIGQAPGRRRHLHRRRAGRHRAYRRRRLAGRRHPGHHRRHRGRGVALGRLLGAARAGPSSPCCRQSGWPWPG
jgi:hypothetical protein